MLERLRSLIGGNHRPSDATASGTGVGVSGPEEVVVDGVPPLRIEKAATKEVAADAIEAQWP